MRMDRSGEAPPDAASVLQRVERAVGWARVGVDDHPRGTSCGAVVRSARAGQDPLRGWREALGDQLRAAGNVAPAHLVAAFVLQWWCQVAAVPIGYAASLGPWLMRPAPADLAFELAAGLYPGRITASPGTALDVVPDLAHRLAAAETAYHAVVADVARGFAPEVRMGSRQRWGVVSDTWHATLHAAASAPGALTGTASRQASDAIAASAPGHAPEPAPRRVSCCFLYLLPGCDTCATCPRRRTAPVAAPPRRGAG